MDKEDEDEEDERWEVEMVKAHRYLDGHPEYRIKWKDYNGHVLHQLSRPPASRWALEVMEARPQACRRRSIARPSRR